MNPLDVIIYPEMQEEYAATQILSTRMVKRGFMSWELGPLCTRDHAWRLAELREDIKALLKATPEPASPSKEYLRAKQALHSTLNRKP